MILFNLFLILTSSFRLISKEPQKSITNEFYSIQGKYYGLVEFNKQVNKEIPVSRFTLYEDKTGKKLWVDNAPDAEYFYISDLGWVVGVFGSYPKARLTFYNEKGKKIIIKELDSPQGYSFSFTGELFFANSSKDGLLAYDRFGRIAGRFGPAGNFLVAPNSEIVVIVLDNQLAFVPIKGQSGTNPNATIKLKTPAVRHLNFSPDSKFLLVCEKNNLSVLSIREKKTLWQIETEDNLLIGKVSSNGRVIVVGEDWINSKRVGILSLFDYSGIKLAEETITFSQDYETITEIKELYPSRLVIKTTDEVYLYEIETR